MLIRRERSTDAAAIDAVHRAAFAYQAPEGAEPIEVGLVHALRADVGWIPALSLVAVDDEGTVVGHVVATAGTLAGGPAVGIGPIGVLPDQQRSGIGSALMYAALGAADALGNTTVVLLGDGGYYARFGFRPAAELGIESPDPAWGDHFQALPLDAWSDEVGGPFRYAAPFDEL